MSAESALYLSERGVTDERSSCAWFVPEYTDNPNEAANGFDFIDTAEKDDPQGAGNQYPDLSAESGHEPFKAYIRPTSRGDESKKVTSVTLLRYELGFLKMGIWEPSKETLCNVWGLEGVTSDINAHSDRGGSYLYLGWN